MGKKFKKQKGSQKKKQKETKPSIIKEDKKSNTNIEDDFMEEEIDDDIINENNPNNNNNNKKQNTLPTFDFELDTNVLDKLNPFGAVNPKKKKNKISDWNYSNIIQDELSIQKTKKNKINSYLESTSGDNTNTKVDTNPNLPKEKTQKEKNNNDDDLIDTEQLDKFENDVFSKDSSFTSFSLSKLIIKGLSEMEYYSPTKVQEKVIPIALKGHDIFVNAETGSGKTACYLLPIIQNIILKKTSKKTESFFQALIIVPTRELAMQCNQMLTQLSKFVNISYVFFCGGMAVENQVSQLRKSQPDIIISTPGRLIDLLYNQSALSLENISTLVLDEADKLLELGFKDSILEILELIKQNKDRQTMLFSATLNPKIIDLGNHALINPIKIKISHSAILHNLTPYIVRMKFTDTKQNEFEKRLAYLLNIIKEKKLTRTIIFFNTKTECHRTYLHFENNTNYSSAELHSGISQSERIQSLDLFQKGEVDFLLATDIAGRGIDVDKVRCVINFEMPLVSDRFVHRVGRTARKGYLGIAVSICDEKERLVLKKILKKEDIFSQLQSLPIKNEEIKETYKQLLKQKEELQQTVDDEMVEKQAKLAERDIDKTINFKLYEDQIKNRPKKKWFENKKIKAKRRKEMMDEFKKKKEELYE